MFSTLNTLLNKNTRQLPDADKASDLCNSFARFSTQKVSKIRRELDELPVTQCQSQIITSQGSNTNATVVALDEFKHVSVNDVKAIVLTTTTKSCSLDRIPMWLLKDNINSVIDVGYRTVVLENVLV